jgi:hypothetical protein
MVDANREKVERELRTIVEKIASLVKMLDAMSDDAISTLPVALEKRLLPRTMVDACRVIDEIMGVEIRSANTLEIENRTVLNELSIMFPPIRVENVPPIVLNWFTFAEETMREFAIAVENVPLFALTVVVLTCREEMVPPFMVTKVMVEAEISFTTVF